MLVDRCYDYDTMASLEMYQPFDLDTAELLPMPSCQNCCLAPPALASPPTTNPARSIHATTVVRLTTGKRIARNPNNPSLLDLAPAPAPTLAPVLVLTPKTVLAITHHVVKLLAPLTDFPMENHGFISKPLSTIRRCKATVLVWVGRIICLTASTTCQKSRR
jgi:hypothetical protein